MTGACAVYSYYILVYQVKKFNLVSNVATNHFVLSLCDYGTVWSDVLYMTLISYNLYHEVMGKGDRTKNKKGDSSYG